MKNVRHQTEGDHEERYCRWVIYGTPLLLVVISLSFIELQEEIVAVVGLSSITVNLDEVLVWLNLLLAALASAGGEVYRSGSIARRVFSGALYAFVGALLYLGLFGVISMIVQVTLAG